MPTSTTSYRRYPNSGHNAPSRGRWPNHFPPCFSDYAFIALVCGKVHHDVHLVTGVSMTGDDMAEPRIRADKKKSPVDNRTGIGIGFRLAAARRHRQDIRKSVKVPPQAACCQSAKRQASIA
jgi:hypothetical protein